MDNQWNKPSVLVPTTLHIQQKCQYSITHTHIYSNTICKFHRPTQTLSVEPNQRRTWTYHNHKVCSRLMTRRKYKRRNDNCDKRPPCSTGGKLVHHGALLVEGHWQRKRTYSGGKYRPSVTLRQQLSYRLARDRSRASAMTGRRLPEQWLGIHICVCVCRERARESNSVITSWKDRIHSVVINGCRCKRVKW